MLKLIPKPFRIIEILKADGKVLQTAQWGGPPFDLLWEKALTLGEKAIISKYEVDETLPAAGIPKKDSQTEQDDAVVYAVFDIGGHGMKDVRTYRCF